MLPNGMPKLADRQEWLARAERENAFLEENDDHESTRVAETIAGEFHEPCMQQLRAAVLAVDAKVGGWVWVSVVCLLVYLF